MADQRQSSRDSAEVRAPSAGVGLYRVLVVDPGCFTPDYDTEICKALARRGLRVSLVTAPHQNDSNHRFSSDLDVRVDFFSAAGFPKGRRARRLCKGLTYPYYWERLLRLVQREQPHVVHFQWLLVPPVDLLNLRRLQGQHPQVAVVVTIHNIGGPAVGAGARYLSRILSLADGLIVHGHASKSALLERFALLEQEKIYVAPHGPLYLSDLPQQDKVTTTEDKKHVALVFGEIKKYKGLDILAAALSSLRPEDKARLKVVVAGKLEETSCGTYLEKLRHAGVELELRIGYVPCAEVANLFRAADIALLPYKAITQSGVLLTALTQGRAVIASALGDMPELVSLTQGGWCVTPSDPAALATALHQALATEVGDLRKRGMRARARLLTEVAWDSAATSTIACYGRASDQRRGDTELRAATA